MNQIMVVYWPQTGNTEIMANAVAEGVKEAGRGCTVAEASSVSADVLKDVPVSTLGRPVTGAEVLEENEMRPLTEAVETFASGEQIDLFGSYGWGNGQWIRNWEERVQNIGAVLIGDQGMIAQGVPDEDTLSQCRELGRSLAGLLA